MQKIPNVFCRDPETGRITNQFNPECLWVADGVGIPTRKYDGTCCLYFDAKWFKRYEVKQGKQPPEGFVAVCEIDPNTGKQQGWLEVGDGPQDQYHREAIASGRDGDLFEFVQGQTYELCGPKVQSNPEKFDRHLLIRHGNRHFVGAMERTYEGLKTYLTNLDTEGIVFHHPDGRMAKVRQCDFGIEAWGR